MARMRLSPRIRFALLAFLLAGSHIIAEAGRFSPQSGGGPRGGSALSPQRSTAGWGDTQTDTRVRDGGGGDTDFYAGKYNGEGRPRTPYWTGDEAWRADGHGYWRDDRGDDDRRGSGLICMSLRFDVSFSNFAVLIFGCLRIFIRVRSVSARSLISYLCTLRPQRPVERPQRLRRGLLGMAVSRGEAQQEGEGQGQEAPAE